MTNSVNPGVAYVEQADREIGRRIREAREAKHWSQQELADALSPITRQQVSNYELGRSGLRASALQKMCEVLAVNLYWLVTGRGGREL